MNLNETLNKKLATKDGLLVMYNIYIIIRVNTTLLQARSYLYAKYAAAYTL